MTRKLELAGVADILYKGFPLDDVPLILKAMCQNLSAADKEKVLGSALSLNKEFKECYDALASALSRLDVGTVLKLLNQAQDDAIESESKSSRRTSIAGVDLPGMDHESLMKKLSSRKMLDAVSDVVRELCRTNNRGVEVVNSGF